MMSFFMGRQRFRPRTFVVECKRCRRDVPAGVEQFPTGNSVVECPLCGERRRYRPTEAYLGTPHQLVSKAKH